MATYYGTLKSRSVDDPTATTAHQICTNNWPKRGHITSEKPFKVEVSGTTVTISSNGSATSSATWTLINHGMILTAYWNNSPIFTKSVSGASYQTATQKLDEAFATPFSFNVSGSGSLRIGFGIIGNCVQIDPFSTPPWLYGFPTASQSAMDDAVIPVEVILDRPPSLSGATITSSNPLVYRVTAGISGIDWGIGYSNRKLTCNISYTLDGISYSYIAGTWTDGATSKSITIDGLSLAASNPWTKVPDDETITITWKAETNVGSASKSKTQYCQMSYTAYVIEESVNGGKPIEADLFVSNVAGQQPNKHIRRITTINS